MTAWLILNLWHLLTLLVFLGPLGLLLHRWDRRERAITAAHLDRGLPQPVTPSWKSVTRAAVAFAVFGISGYVASAMYEASEALSHALSRPGMF